MNITTLLPVGLTLLIASFFSQAASTSGMTGESVMREAINRDSGFGDTVMEIKMTLANQEGQESHRFMKIHTLEVQGDGDKLLTYFHAPRDIKGTSLLAYTHINTADEQWLYLPATRRVKRISSANKSGSFMGSEFAFEDLASEEFEKYLDYKLLKEEPCGSQICYVVERKPIDENTGYSRHLVWVDKEHFRFIQIDYFDRRNELLKTRIFKDYQLFLDKYWRSSEITMSNHQSGKKTTLLVKNIDFQIGLTDQDFDQLSLKRAR